MFSDGILNNEPLLRCLFCFVLQLNCCEWKAKGCKEGRVTKLQKEEGRWGERQG